MKTEIKAGIWIHNVKKFLLFESHSVLPVSTPSIKSAATHRDQGLEQTGISLLSLLRLHDFAKNKIHLHFKTILPRKLLLQDDTS